MMKSSVKVLCLVALAVVVACSGCTKLRSKKRSSDGRDPNVLASRDSLDVEELGMDLERWDPNELGVAAPGQFEPVYFDYDSAQIRSDQQEKVNAVIDTMRSSPTGRIIVEGHCDERGSREYNLALGERRAQAVREYLIGQGVANDRIQTRSFGEENPAVAGHDENAYRYNRRAELLLYQ
jgi:peptidoglycan-associated lipoprotein